MYHTYPDSQYTNSKNNKTPSNIEILFLLPSKPVLRVFFSAIRISIIHLSAISSSLFLSSEYMQKFSALPFHLLSFCLLPFFFLFFFTSLSHHVRIPLWLHIFIRRRVRGCHSSHHIAHPLISLLIFMQSHCQPIYTVYRTAYFHFIGCVVSNL